MRGGVFVLTVLAVQAMGADEPLWGEWKAGGSHCKKGNIQVLTSGGSLAVLFNEFGATMRQGVREDGTRDVKTCTFRIALNPPTGLALAGFQQVYSGGLIKSKKARADLTLRYRLGNTAMDMKTLSWREGLEVGPEHKRAYFSKVFTDEMRIPHFCREKVEYHVELDFDASRNNRDEYLVGGLDSLDAEAGSNVLMVPQWKPCKERPPENSGGGRGQGGGNGGGNHGANAGSGPGGGRPGRG